MCKTHTNISVTNAGLNLIGALALRLHDLQMDAAINASGMSPTACAGLVSISHQDEAQTIGDVAALCMLSHSAAVRLVERLENLNLVNRIAAKDDRREVHVKITPAGYEMRDRILEARRSVIEPIVSKIPEKDQQTIEHAAGMLLSEMTGSRLESEQICRLCDAVACGGDECPVEKKALELEGAATDCP